MHSDRTLLDFTFQVMYKSILKPLLFLLKPEQAHHLTVKLLKITLSIPIINTVFKKTFQFEHPSRPLTHDLMKNILQEYEVELKEVVVNNLVDGIFHAKLVCMKEGDIVEIDSRTSDALAMAVRFDCPIYTFEFILETAGIVLDEDENQEEKPKRTRRKRQKASLTSMPVDDLEKMLQEVLENEDYEKAAKIRDELNKRESN